jgi:hypothetical protein
MGVAASKDGKDFEYQGGPRIKGNEGEKKEGEKKDGADSGTGTGTGTGDGDAKKDDAKKDDANKEGEKSEDASPAEETSIDKIKQNNMKLWKPYLSSIFNLDKIKADVKQLEKDAKVASLSPPEDKAYIDKKIFIEEKDVSNFVNGSKDYEKDLMEYVDKELLINPELKAVTEKTVEEGNKFKKDTKPEDVKLIYDSLIKAVKIARNHHALLEVLNFVVNDDMFKNKVKEINVSGTDEATAANKGKSENKPEEKKPEEKKPEEKNDVPPPAGGGGYESDTGSISSGGSIGSDSSASISEASIGGASIGEASIGEASIGEASIGGFGKTDEEKAEAARAKRNEKDYKGKKDEMYKDAEEKKKKFLNDIIAVNKFLDENKDNLLKMYEPSKVGKNVNTKAEEGPLIAAALVNTLNEYKPEEDKTGAAGKNPPAGAAPAGAEGDAKPEDKKGDAKPEDKKGDVKPEDKKSDAKPEDKKSDAKPEDAAKPKEGGYEEQPMQDGGGKKIRKKRSRKNNKNYKNKPQKINISINVGNKNSISDSSSSSSSSSSDSSTCSSTSSSSDSDDDIPNVVIKHKKHKKHKKKAHKHKSSQA